MNKPTPVETTALPSEVHVRAPDDLSQFLRSARGWRARFSVWRNDSPSWLVSLILHLIIFLLITSVAAPPMQGRRRGSGKISLEAGFSQATQESAGPIVSVTPLDVPPMPLAEPAEATGLPEEIAPTPPRAPERTRSPANSGTPSGGQPSVSPTGKTRQLEIKKPSKYAGYLNRLRTSTPVGAVTLQVLQPLTEVSLDPEQRRLDHIVDDFIAFDVGRLSGPAGRAAQQRFAKLGPEAIPALVRGLNKSAGIHASCPVGVIAGKLMTTLRLASDPSLRDYAINNVGSGVPETAPHYHRLMALRKNWLNAPSLPQPVAALVERIEKAGEGELMELTLALTDAPAETVAAALRSHDDYLASAAILSIIQRQRIQDPLQRAELRRALVYFCTHTQKSSLRSLANDADLALR